jgi:hypothetical protein
MNRPASVCLPQPDPNADLSPPTDVGGFEEISPTLKGREKEEPVVEEVGKLVEGERTMLVLSLLAP